LIVSEFATNHGGDWGWIQRAVSACSGAGVDVCKVQAFSVKYLRPDDPQYEWLCKSELSIEHLADFVSLCFAFNVVPLATVFDAKMPAVLSRLGYKSVKVGSGDAMREDVLRACIDAEFSTIYVSTGLLDNRTTRWAGSDDIQIVPFHCVTRYPADPGMANLSRMKRLTYGDDPFGYSDHTVGIEACVFALAMGASVIEKHFSLPGCGRNQAWDVDPATFWQLAQWRDRWVEMRGGPEQDHEDNSEADRFIGRWCCDGK